MSSNSSAVAADALLVRDVDGQYRPARAEEVLSQARRVLSQRVRRGATMSSPQAVKDHLRLEIGALEHEVFCVLFLDAQHRIIALKQMFRGTVTQTSVYPREVVKEALGCNAAAVIRVVVDFPLVPVTARKGLGELFQANSISPTNATPRRLASARNSV